MKIFWVELKLMITPCALVMQLRPAGPNQWQVCCLGSSAMVGGTLDEAKVQAEKWLANYLGNLIGLLRDG